jgi:hypothetical protein
MRKNEEKMLIVFPDGTARESTVTRVTENFVIHKRNGYSGSYFVLVHSPSRIHLPVYYCNHKVRMKELVKVAIRLEEIFDGWKTLRVDSDREIMKEAQRRTKQAFSELANGELP